MKISRIVIALAVLLTACTRASDHEHGLAQLKAKPGSPASPVTTTKADAQSIDKVKFAGAVVFEGGEAKDQNLFSKTKTPIYRVIVCIPRTGETNLGEIDFNFKELGIPDYNKNTSNDPKAAKNSWADLESFTFNYTMSGQIQNPAPGLGYGQVNFAANAVNPKWSADPGTADVKAAQEIWMNDFKVAFDQTSLASFSDKFYYSEGQIYYFSTTLYRFTQQVDKQDLITDCENSNQQMIVQKDLKK
jgi:hypothetical protein